MIETTFSKLASIRHPIVLAPMAGVAGGALAAAVSRAGGLGMIGGGYADPEWTARELDAAGDDPIGIGFITWRLDEAPRALAIALARRPRAVWLSFGDIDAYVERIKASGALCLAQVQSVTQARRARAAGADVIIAQGSEAGGHAGMRATLPLVPAIVDAVRPLPVLAAGGIGDGRSVAAAFLLGAAGVVLGTRFYAADESLATYAAKNAALLASGDDTVRGAVFDRLRGWQWPAGYALRTLANDMTRKWPADAAELAGKLAVEQARFASALAADDPRVAPVIVGEAIEFVRERMSAERIVIDIMRDAERLLSNAPNLVTT